MAEAWGKLSDVALGPPSLSLPLLPDAPLKGRRVGGLTSRSGSWWVSHAGVVQVASQRHSSPKLLFAHLSGRPWLTAVLVPPQLALWEREPKEHQRCLVGILEVKKRWCSPALVIEDRQLSLRSAGSYWRDGARRERGRGQHGQQHLPGIPARGSLQLPPRSPGSVHQSPACIPASFLHAAAEGLRWPQLHTFVALQILPLAYVC